MLAGHSNSIYKKSHYSEKQYYVSDIHHFPYITTIQNQIMFNQNHQMLWKNM